jgi:hypothetical protein
MTTVAETDTFGTLQKSRPANGGLRVSGFDDGMSSQALQLFGYQGAAADTTKDINGAGVIQAVALIKSGTGTANPGADANLLTIRAGSSTTRFIFDAEGSAHAEVEWVAFDSYDDLALVSEIESELLKGESPAGTANRHMLEKTGIIGKDSWHMENGRPRAMVNTTRLSMLHHGALMQAAEKIKALESRLLAIEGAK